MPITNIRMRLLAERTLRLLDAYKDAHAPLAAVAPIVIPLAQAYMDAYDRHINFKPVRRERVDGGRSKVRELHGLMRSWSFTLQTLVPGFTANSLKGTLSVPDSVLHDAKRLLETLRDQSEPLPSGTALPTQLAELHAAATMEWTNAQRALAEHGELETAVATAKDKLYAPFMNFRATLGRFLGLTHRDYQQLRVSTGRRGNQDDEEMRQPPEQPSSTPSANDNRAAA